MEAGRGLSGSRFAPQNSGYGSGFSRGGRGGSNFTNGLTLDFDWDCAGCGFSNFGWRNECFRCNKAKGWTPTEGSMGTQGNNENNAPGLIERRNTPTIFGVPNGTDETRGITSGSASATHLSINERTGNAPRGALSKSIWAPRNRTASQKYGDNRWTKVSTNPTTSSHSSSGAPSPPDLGLPYEVQHFILGMMQRILEEACFDLASRWIPDELRDRNWSCSEAVELSAWKKFLPSAIPYNAISPVMSYSLEMGLTDAVRIRNSAVHRHLVDNREIRTLALKAGNLMEMFRDVSRKEKFERLRFELERWDEGSRISSDAARTVLEEALRSIGERPMDDMDWTPNAVSLQEIKDDTRGDQQYGGETDSYHDEMELD